ncbi:MAG: hypothetical protein QM766_05020 [Burkholderiaceae bacterium]
MSTEFPFGIHVGPYEMRARLVPRHQLLDRRSRSCISLEHGLVLFDETLEPARLIEEFLFRTIRFIHYVHGLNQEQMNEEAYTHSLSAGLVAFARNNPKTWLWMNWMMQMHYAPHARFVDVLQGRGPQVAMPRRVVCRKHVVSVGRLPERDARTRLGDYDYELFHIRIYPTLTGTVRATVLFHEIVHGLHHAAGLADDTPWQRYAREQARLVIHFAKANPGAWRYLLKTLDEPVTTSVAPRLAA